MITGNGTVGIFDGQDCVYKKIKMPDNSLMLTFDDGPGKHTNSILKLLKSLKIKATFFVLGENFNKDILRRQIKEGHCIGTHTYSHPCFSKIKELNKTLETQLIEDITKCQKLVETIIGKDAYKYFRAPGGKTINESMCNAFYPYIKNNILWTIDPRDWDTPGIDSIIKSILKAKPGDIILCHDGGLANKQTYEALKYCLPKFLEKGYKFITLDEAFKYIY